MSIDNSIRLQKIFTDCGILSRRAAEAAILAGEVTVNGQVATLGDKADPEVDTILYKGVPVRTPEERKDIYILLNKPRGYVTTVHDPQGRKCVLDLLPPECGRVYPVGRLDMISEGALLFTNDGELTNRLTHPGHEIPKVYRVKVAGNVSAEQLALLRSPLEIDGYRIRPVEIEVIDVNESGTVLKMTLYEGRNRQIRKMCAAAGLTVKRLNRVSIGKVRLNNLPVGKWRYLEESEIAYLKKSR